MSDLIPFEIQEEIIKRLPLKSLIQFRSVSKPWKSLIDSTEFITRHTLRHAHHPQRLIVLYRDPRHKYLSFLDDQTFPQKRFVPAIPLSVERLKCPKIVGSSQGLLCLSGFYQDPRYPYPNFRFVNRRIVIWNPSIRKAVIVPNLCSSRYAYVIGFGVSPVTGDPTIVEIFRDDNMRWVVRVFKLSTGSWTNYPSNNLPTQVYNVKRSQAVLDKFIYWFAYDEISKTETNRNLILSFDMTNYKFGVVDLPERLAFKAEKHFEISKLRESLVVLKYRRRNHVCDVWLMENGARKSFKKLFTIREPNSEIKIVGFNKSDYAIMEMRYKGEDPEEAALAVYDPSSKHINDLGINGAEDYFYVNTYTETLLLLDQPELKASDFWRMHERCILTNTM